MLSFLVNLLYICIMIEFIEDTSEGYAHRTYENARLADATLAFAVDFETSGEKMTKAAAEKYNKVYCQIPLLNVSNSKELKKLYGIIAEVADVLKANNCHSLNIAGNGMSRLAKHKVTQHRCDSIVQTTIIQLALHGVDITEIRSGGQTGADESGLRVADNLGVHATCLCPKGWRFRTEKEDITNEELFKKRFE